MAGVFLCASRSQSAITSFTAEAIQNMALGGAKAPRNDGFGVIRRPAKVRNLVPATFVENNRLTGFSG